MGLKEFIANSILRSRLEKDHIVVVYDPERRYAGICQEMEQDGIAVVDASESSLESRFQAMDELVALGQPQPGKKALLVYVPAAKPRTDQEKLNDPFAIYGEAGSVFPKDDGDSYQGICLKAKPAGETEIRRVFDQDPNPSFAVIDAIGGGDQWPQLRAVLNGQSAKELLLGLLCPTDRQIGDLKQTEGWASEAKDFLRSEMGLTLNTKAKSWQPISDELWRFLLFSEFAFDLPGELPAALATVPRAPAAAEPTVGAVCEQMRHDLRTRSKYIDKAVAIELELGLVEACKEIVDLGVTDTFPFEERTFLRRAIDRILNRDTEGASDLLERHKGSVWLEMPESQEQWDLVRSAMNLSDSCSRMMQALPQNTANSAAMLNFYVGDLKDTDRLQREFEQSVHNFLKLPLMMDSLVEQVRGQYRKLAENMQDSFIKQVEKSGWPVAGFTSNGDVYDKFIAPHLTEQGNKCAYIWVDALRYELGAELERSLSEEATVEIKPGLAYLPTITPVGMASLLPGAGSKLTFESDGMTLVPKLDGASVKDVNQRMNVLKRLLNDRFEEMTLSDFNKPKKKIAESTDLLILRSTEIDSLLENDPAATLRNVPVTLNQIRTAVHKLQLAGFAHIVIVSDHGFFLNLEPEAGDVCQKPPGTWKELHHRFMIGSGNDDNHNFVMAADKLGITGNFSQCAGPRSMAPYRSGEVYFHGGLSLQEAVVPILLVKPLRTKQPASGSGYKVEISYKNGAARITTLLPVIAMTLVPADMFADAENVEVLVEARDAKGSAVGKPRPGGDVNPATGTVTLAPNVPTQITISMDTNFEGKFTIFALNPVTGAGFGTLELKTDYLT